mgnify:CR=1 FL=1
MSKFISSSWGDVLAVLAGILLTLSFSPFDFYVLAFVALLVFKLVLLPELGIKTTVFRGFLFGLGLFGSGVSWVFVSMVVAEQSGFILPLIMTLFFCAVWAVFPAIFAYLYYKVRVQGWLDSLSFACVWVLVEYFRGEWMLGGFPWLQVAYSQLDSIFSGYIPVVGVYGTGFIIVLVASLLADALLAKQKQSKFVLSILILLVFTFLLQDRVWTDVAGSPIKATLIQGNIAQKDKWQVENRNTTLKQYYDDTAEHWDSDLIIWPETAIPAYYAEVKEDYLSLLEAEAIKYNTTIIVSLPYRDKKDNLYNAVLALGRAPGMYKKTHLLPFGEYLPWQPLSGYLLGLMNVRLGNFSAGDIEQKLLEAGEHKFITSICYEDAFGEQNIRHIEQAKFLVNVTNDGWFDGSIEPYQHLQIARMRALESGRYLLRATNTGVTAVINEQGKVISQAPIRERAVITVGIEPRSGLTPYARIGDKPVLLVIVLLLLLGVSKKLILSGIYSNRH